MDLEVQRIYFNNSNYTLYYKLYFCIYFKGKLKDENLISHLKRYYDFFSMEQYDELHLIIAFHINNKYRSKLIRRFSKNSLNFLLSDTIKKDNWFLLSKDYESMIDKSQKSLKLTSHIKITCPENFNIKELFDIFISNVGNQDYRLLCKLFDEFENYSYK